MAQGDLVESSTAAKENIQPPAETKPKLDENCEFEKRKNYDDVAEPKILGSANDDTAYDGDGDDEIGENDDDSVVSDGYDEDNDHVEEEEEEENEGDCEESGDDTEEEEEEEEEEVSSDVAAEKFRGQIGDYHIDFLTTGGEKVDHKTWIRYWRQIRRSQGFDIEDYPGDCFLAGIVPLREFRTDFRLYPELIGLARMAIRGYNNDNGTRYVLEDIVSVNSEVVSGIMFYITFAAKNPDAGDALETFQAKVFDGIEETDVEFCRLKKSVARGAV